MTSNKKTRKRLKAIDPDKYNLGSFVVNNQQKLTNAGLLLGGLAGDNAAGDFLTGASSGFATGASIGSIVPGVGTAIGGAVGGLIGGIGSIFGGGKRRREQERLRAAQSKAIKDANIAMMDSTIDRVNEDPMGVFADGGMVTDPPKNIRKKRRQELYGDISNFLGDRLENAYEAGINVPNDNAMAINIIGALSGSDTDGNPAPMDPTLKEIKTKIKSLPKEVTNQLLERDWGNGNIISNINAIRKAGISVPSAYKYYNHLRNLKKQGYTFEEGGDIGFTEINIEKGELQINPESGKILREYTGINPETGGMYEAHAKGNKKDSPNNIVSAEEGTFIITKSKAKEYKDSIDTNDKLRQESIMQNIRNNKKRNKLKFATGGRVNPLTSTLFSPTPTYTSPVNNLSVPDLATNPINGNVPNIQSFNFGKVLDTAIDLAPGLINIFQGNKTPNYQSRITGPSARYRNNILQNMPQDINFAPIRNDIMRQAEAANDTIDQTTSSSAIARANKNNVLANTQNRIGRARLDANLANNQIRGQRASIYSGLDQFDAGNYYNTNQFNFRVDETNRLLDAAGRQQRNTGFSQLQEVYRNNQRNRRLREMDELRLSLLPDMFYGAAPQINNWLNRLNQGG